ncbi:MAG TPA: Xaa-Pro peptidase family protein [Conexibacter sp.]|nr:Xaa-Pro peptidase family protein [Conexibacter sp.]
MTGAASAPLAPAGLAADLERRHASVAARLRELGAACLVASRKESVLYLTGYTTMTWKMTARPIVAVVTADGRLSVLVAETEADSARLRIPGADVRAYVELDPVEESMHLLDGAIQFAPHAARVLSEIVEEAGEGLVAVDGLDAVWPPVGQLTRLLPNVAGRTCDASSLVWDLRLRKGAWEVERMRAASAVLERAYDLLREQLRPGMTEREIAHRFSVAQLEAGAHEVGPFAVVAGTDRGFFGFPTERRWDAGELLYLDGAAIVDGYWSDFCRTFAARPAQPHERDGYARARAGLEAAIALEPLGRTAGEIGFAMAEAMDIAPSDVGFGRFGHGIGLDVPEPPSLHAADATRLDAGFTICIEPAVVHEGLNFVVEEEHLVTDGGFERLTPPAPDQILVV